MVKSKFFTGMALLAALAFSSLVTHAYDAYGDDIVKVQKLEKLYTPYDVMSAVPVTEDVIKLAGTIATYELRAVTSMVDTKRVFRDFRTIADSGGNRSNHI